MRTLILTYPTPMEEDAPLEGKFLQLRLAARNYIAPPLPTLGRRTVEVLVDEAVDSVVPQAVRQFQNSLTMLI